MKYVIFYDKDTKEIMGMGGYSNPNDMPTQYSYIETTEEVVNDSDGMYEIYDDAGELKVRKIGMRPQEPTIVDVMNKLNIIEADVKDIKVGAK